MRDLSQSPDDLAIQSAKEKLLQLSTRPGYLEAMQTKPSGSRSGRWLSNLAALVLLALAFGSCANVEATWLRVVLVVLFVGMSIFAALLAIGIGPEPAPKAFPVVLLDKQLENEVHHVQLLLEDGTRLRVMTLESIYDMLRVGDVGVAHIKPGDAEIVTAFHRL